MLTQQFLWPLLPFLCFALFYFSALHSPPADLQTGSSAYPQCRSVCFPSETWQRNHQYQSGRDDYCKTIGKFESHLLDSVIGVVSVLICHLQVIVGFALSCVCSNNVTEDVFNVDVFSLLPVKIKKK